jgi:hypothetical protein
MDAVAEELSFRMAGFREEEEDPPAHADLRM